MKGRGRTEREKVKGRAFVVTRASPTLYAERLCETGFNCALTIATHNTVTRVIMR